MVATVYRLFAYLGLMALTASFLMGFRYDPGAPAENVFCDVALYGAFILVHIVMTAPAFKKAVYGKPEGTLFERRIYIAMSVVTWVAVYWLHWPVPGFGYVSPDWLAYLGYCGALLSVFAFFEFATFEQLGNLVGMPGAALSHTAGGETPLMTEGPYASVRHPMYRAAVCLGACSLLIHPNAGQLLFATMIGASFVGFIPIEERQLLKARGEQYREYMLRTPYRLFRGVW